MLPEVMVILSFLVLFILGLYIAYGTKKPAKQH
jgi:VIT1/CCC1 family predicted Fe2+/Mn2+ transporter